MGALCRRSLQPLILLALAFAILAAGCGGDDDAGLTEGDLRNATYTTEALREGQAELSDGEFRAPAAPGSALEIVIQIADFSTGDLDDDGDDDAAVVLREQTGGTGTFYSVHAILNDTGEARDAASQFLGDRIKIEAVEIDDGEITVDLLDRPEGAPFAEAPSVPVTRRFRLEDSELNEISPP